MLSHIDRELFPDRCEVIVLNDPQRYVYPIFKNGRSALLEYSSKHRCSILVNQQIRRAATIEIYIRDPAERFVSGISTFCQMTMRDHPHLDRDTVGWFAERYLFLNRHYTTQFSWILNLARYASDDCRLSIRSVQDLKTDLGLVEPDGVRSVINSQAQRIRSNTDLQMYIRLDQSLCQLIGQDITMNEICKQMKQKDTAAWNYVVSKNLDILNKCIVRD
jgi:hypothetical protein